MHKFYHKLPNEIEGYKINLSFNRVLKVLDTFENESINRNTKILIAIRLFFEVNTKEIEQELLVAYINLIPKILELIKGDAIESKEEKVVDIKVDSERIYASFLQEYKINLYSELDKMHWFEFKSLLGQLTDKCALGKVIEIRQMEIPKADKSNSKQRNAIIKAKKKVSIIKITPAEEQEANDRALSSAFNSW